MADSKTTIAIEVEVEGIEPSIESIKDLKNAIKAAKDEQVKMANAFGDGSKEYLDATKKLSGLKDKVDDLNDSTQSLKGTGVEQLTQGFDQMKEGIMNLDFDKVKTGFAAMKSGIGAFATSAKTALQGVKGALLATGIGALIVALGVIVAYWDDIKGLVNGVTEEQKKLNAVAKENLTVEQDKLKALESSTNSLKLQGKSEKEILELKIKQLDAVYEKAEVDLQNTIQTQLFQIQAEKRNKEILSGIFDFTLKPIQLIMSAIDLAGKALGKNFGLAESIKKMAIDSVSGDDAEKDAARKKELDASIQLLKDLKEKRAGYQIAINKIDDDAEKAAADAAKKKAEEYKVFLDKRNEEYLKSQQDELEALKKRLLDEDLLRQQQRENELSLDETLRAEKYKKRLLDAELNALNNKEDVDAQIALLEAKRQIELQNLTLTNTERAIINKNYADQEAALSEASEKAKQDKILKIIDESLKSAQNLSDIFFLYKKNKAEKGSKEEMELAKKQFNFNKALQLGFAVMDSYKAITASLAQSPVSIGPVPNPAGIASLVFAATTSAANIAKILATKFDAGGGGATGGGGGSPMPSIPAPPTIATGNNNTNQTTLFDESGQNLSKQKQPQINVTATVGVDEIAKKSNRVEVLEQQSTF